MADGHGTKRKRRSFSLADKIEFIAFVDKHPNKKHVEIAKELDIPVSTLGTILKNKDVILAEIANKSVKTKKLRPAKHETVEDRLFTWFKQVRSSSIPINGNILREKADQIALRLGDASFKATNGWIDRFKNRYDIVYRAVSGESASVDQLTVSEWKDKVLPSLHEKFDEKDIFNVDECALFYNMLPDKTFALKGENCSGGKMSKERVTVLVGANMDGSEKLPALVIGKAAKPRCFKNTKTLPCRYQSSKNAWMTGKIFEQYMHSLDAKMGVKNRKIIMFFDHCAAHPQNMNLRNIEIKFFPANTTSCLQPCDQGIIKVFKQGFRKRLCRRVLRCVENKQPIKKITLLDALHFCAASWEAVEQKTVANCFRKAGFTKIDTTTPPTECEEPEDIDQPAPTQEEWGNLQAALNCECTYEEYASVDDAVLSCELQTVEEICVSHDSEEEGNSDDEQEERKVVSTYLQATQALSVVKEYVESQAGVPDKIMSVLWQMEDYLDETARNKGKQTNINDYFGK